MEFLRLFRWPNLAIIALTQYLIRYGGLYPIYSAHQIAFGTPDFLFLMQALLTALVAAGGNLINDIYDYPIDRINKPHKVFINRIISEKQAYRLYAGLGVLGYAGALLLDHALELFYWGWLFPMSWLLLWWYSAQLKRLAFWGNFTVAFLCGIVNLLVWPAEHGALAQLGMANPNALRQLEQIFVFYALFAFLSTIFREIVKDIEDMDGDRSNGCRTLPIVFGEKKAKALAISAGAFLLGSLAIWAAIFPMHLWTWAYTLAFILPLLLYALHATMKADSPQGYHRASSAIKWLMLLGIFYLPALTWFLYASN